MIDVDSLPSYDASEVGWEPVEPWWDRAHWSWVREHWRRMMPVPAKRSAHRYGR